MKDKKNLLYNSLRSEDEVDFINKRYEIFMQDTTERKLYKYRAVNKYSLSNLENGTMYCSSPKEFNDPFDCKLAMRMTSLGQTMWKHYVNAIINGYNLVEQEDKGKVNINDYTGNDKRIVQALLENSLYSDFFELRKQIEDKIGAGQSVYSMLIDNKAMVSKIMSVLLEESISENVAELMINEGKYLVEHFGEEELLAMNSNDFKLEDIAKRFQIKEDIDEIDTYFEISTKVCPQSDNDIKEKKRKVNEKVKQIQKTMDQNFAVGCLTTDYRNNLMWSHYADGHKGFCIEYDFKDLKNINNLLPVAYSTDRPSIPLECIYNNSKDMNTEVAKALYIALLTKDNIWEYENEWRIIISATEGKNIEMPPISAIYLGAEMPEEDKKKLIEIASKKKIPVKQMIVDRGVYALHAQECAYINQ